MCLTWKKSLRICLLQSSKLWLWTFERMAEHLCGNLLGNSFQSYSITQHGCLEGGTDWVYMYRGGSKVPNSCWTLTDRRKLGTPWSLKIWAGVSCPKVHLHASILVWDFQADLWLWNPLNENVQSPSRNKWTDWEGTRERERAHPASLVHHFSDRDQGENQCTVVHS